MSNTCLNCTNEVPEDADLCAVCWDEIPAIFHCNDCGETCYRKDNDFGGWEVTDEDREPKPLCIECAEIGCEEEEVRNIYINDGHVDDHFEEEYFEEML